MENGSVLCAEIPFFGNPMGWLSALEHPLVLRARLRSTAWTCEGQSAGAFAGRVRSAQGRRKLDSTGPNRPAVGREPGAVRKARVGPGARDLGLRQSAATRSRPHSALRSEEHTSELQSLTHLVCRL